MKSPALCFLVSILLFVRGNNAGWRHRGRQLQQAALSINPLEPVSASTADLVNDPTGLGHLLVRNTDFCSNSFCQLLRSRQGIRRVVPCENLPKPPLTALQARLSHAEAYQEDFGYLSYPPEHYNVPFYVDPTAADGLTGIIDVICVSMFLHG